VGALRIAQTQPDETQEKLRRPRRTRRVNGIGIQSSVGTQKKKPKKNQTKTPPNPQHNKKKNQKKKKQKTKKTTKTTKNKQKKTKKPQKKTTPPKPKEKKKKKKKKKTNQQPPHKKKKQGGKKKGKRGALPTEGKGHRGKGNRWEVRTLKRIKTSQPRPCSADGETGRSRHQRSGGGDHYETKHPNNHPAGVWKKKPNRAGRSGGRDNQRVLRQVNMGAPQRKKTGARCRVAWNVGEFEKTKHPPPQKPTKTQ